jgi:glycerol kinase
MTKHMTPEIYPTVPPTRPEPTEEQSLKATIAYHKRELVRFALEGEVSAVKKECVNIHSLEIQLIELKVEEIRQRAKDWDNTPLGKLS